MLPWLSKADQQRVFPADVSFETPEEQVRSLLGCPQPCTASCHLPVLRNPRLRIRLAIVRHFMHSVACLCTQEAYVRQWARARTGLECNFKVAFYPGRYAAEKGERTRRSTAPHDSHALR